jgi:hypothetical protein
MPLPYFGRDWTLTVTPLCATGGPLTITNQHGDNGALRCTFEVELAANQAYWYADIAIYNCMPAMSQVIQKGDLVTLQAGYLLPKKGLIFSGKVFQPIWERVDETDYRLTLHCLVGLFEDETGHVSLSIDAGTTYLDAVYQVAQAAGITVEQADVQTLSKKTFPKAISVFGPARIFFDTVAIDCHLQMWMGWIGVNIRSLASESSVPDVVYAPPYSAPSTTPSKNGTKFSLIGTPQQTEWGITFRSLLDSSLGLGSLVKVENALVTRQLQQIGTIPTPFVQDGLYAVARIRHTGDTRGNEWYTEITGINSNLIKLFESGVQF